MSFWKSLGERFLASLPLEELIPVAWRMLVPKRDLAWIGDILGKVGKHVQYALDMLDAAGPQAFEDGFDFEAFTKRVADDLDAIPGWRDLEESQRDGIINTTVGIVAYIVDAAKEKTLLTQADRRSFGVRVGALAYTLLDIAAD